MKPSILPLVIFNTDVLPIQAIILEGVKVTYHQAQNTVELMKGPSRLFAHPEAYIQGENFKLSTGQLYLEAAQRQNIEVIQA